MKINRLVYMDSPLPMIFLFHPDDLAHRKDAPREWYSYDFACRKEFEAGNLVAFHPNHDHTYDLRFTSGNLRKKERALQNGSWEWGYTVRHGRVFVDGGLFLPRKEAWPMEDAFAEQWVDLPNGEYRVTVTAIVPRTNYSLSAYIIRFESVRAPLRLALSPVPPFLEGYRDSEPRAGTGVSADAVYEGELDVSFQGYYPLLVVPKNTVLPGETIEYEVLFSTSRALNDYKNYVNKVPGNLLIIGVNKHAYVVVAPSGAVTPFAVLCWYTGSYAGGDITAVDMKGERLVRILERIENDPLPMVRVELITRPSVLLTAAQVEELKAVFTRYADRHMDGEKRLNSPDSESAYEKWFKMLRPAQHSESEKTISAFDREHVAATTTGTSLTTRLLEILSLSIETKFRLYAASDAERADELRRFMETAS